MAGNHNSGRRPKPTALKVLEGRRGHRALNEHEPKPEAGAPECPGWLHKTARELWGWIVPQLEQMGVIGRCDVVDLVALCQAWARWRQAEDEIDEFGITYETLTTLNDKGEVVQPDDPRAQRMVRTVKENPACKVADRERRACTAAASRLGLTPTMRGKIVAHTPEPTKPSLLDGPTAG